jgi:hypothetical protein
MISFALKLPLGENQCRAPLAEPADIRSPQKLQLEFNQKAARLRRLCRCARTQIGT